jgi:predicted NAD/FAD-dependent oxidoreductase
VNNKPNGVAIIGGGLAGLTAAYWIRRATNLPITIFESEDRLGGRVSTNTDPPGEHGARYVLGSELKTTLKQHEFQNYGLPNGKSLGWLLKHELEISFKTLNGKGLPHIWFLKGSEPRPFRRSAPWLQQTCPDAAWVFRQTRSPDLPADISFETWIGRHVSLDQHSRKLLDTLLLGEICAAWKHVTARYAMECLDSLINPKESWHCIKGGSETIAKKLLNDHAYTVRLNSPVKTVRRTRNGEITVSVRHGRTLKTHSFQAVIMSCPDGHCLVTGLKSPQGHYHSYISFLFSFRQKPSLTHFQKVNLVDGLYTDHPLANYLEAAKTPTGWTLRILAAHADRYLKLGNHELEQRCLKAFRQLSLSPDYEALHIQRWKQGLACGGTARKFDKVERGIYVCGDRYGAWPSMACAMVSGAWAADAVVAELGH